MKSSNDEITNIIIKNQDSLKKYISYSVNDKYLADDIFQETLIICITKYDSLQNKELFLQWAKRISKNIYIKILNSDIRSEQFDETIHIEDEVFDQIEIVYGKQKFKTLLTLLDLLPSTQKGIAVDYYLKGISRSDLCRNYNISYSIFDSRLQRARSKMRKYIRRRHTRSKDQDFINKFNDILKGEYTMDEFRIEISQSLIPELIESESNMIESLKNQRDKFRSDFRVEIPTVHVIDNEFLKESEYIILRDEKRVHEGQLSSNSKLSEINSIISTVFLEQYST